jgi:exodeoxyribonuclease VII small subunit
MAKTAAEQTSAVTGDAAAARTSGTEGASLPENYEAALAELESLVGRMEDGALSLEESLAAYRRGAALVGFCQQQLEKVEQQVRVLDGDTLKPLPADVQRATQGAGTTNDDGDDDL